MLSEQRKTHLLELLRRDGRVVAKTVAADLGISEDSIRRDLRELAEAGLARRVYGGALPMDAAEVPFAERGEVEPASKARVARAALVLIEPGMTIALDAGTTSMAIARILPRGARLTIATPSPHVAIAAAEHSDARVVLLGGELGRHSMVSGGALALEAISRIGADRLLLGASGVHPDHGVTTDDPDDAAVKRALAAASRETYLVVSSEKLGARAQHPVLSLDDLAGLVVDPADRDDLDPRLRHYAVPDA
ncbi:DeoR/GlpR family DNA-binding transcription regulator [Homoserinibacter sp. GY 40078]|uniref:DeoR/GlpR family DNA-binding transcription regulator n=1 Tax=Homoserinibacter sp. GY 40078 TaxID=2603275 RepID=UPI0011CAE448|nr:DeoR/GlpR family DNA-binding transcription regulator [Homoserinibacter sp. GY 40078]TXK18610.1 DeoR/GlpR transcriptional regulator [Homoserinibacter sp. GY 40078]